jgi:hypothetical protein
VRRIEVGRCRLAPLWFSDNDRLQCCLVNDADHVTPGHRGMYVLLIRQALMMLDGLSIEDTELEVLHCTPRGRGRRPKWPLDAAKTAREMRAGPSDSGCRVRVQTAANCCGPMARVVSVCGKGGMKPVRCELVRRT